MERTGIVRRIDDLGRIVIPKEIRHMLRVKEWDPFEIYLKDGCVVFKKYNESTDSVDSALQKLKNAVDEAPDLSCKQEFLVSIFEMQERLKLESGIQ